MITNLVFIMTIVFLGGVVGTTMMTFMIYIVRLKIVDEPLGIATKIGARKRGGLGDGNGCLPSDRCCTSPNNLCNGFLKILPGPSLVKSGLVLKK